MNKDINKPKAGLILYHESGDEIHWMAITPELFQEINDLIDSVPNNEWDNQKEHEIFQQVRDLLLNYHDNPSVLEKSFTQTWVLESAQFFTKYEFIGLRTIPMY